VQKYGLRVGNPAPRTSQPGGVYSGATAWNKTVIVETLATYTPPFGRSQAGAWGEGNGKAYNDVIRVVFYHGTRQGAQAPIDCTAKVANKNLIYKDLYFNLPDYHSYVSEYYLAPNKGILQESFLYAEDGSYWELGSCEMGILFSPDDPRRNNWIWYVDDP
jgi:hypothetical protein